MQILILSFSRWMGSSCVGSAHCHIVVCYRKRKSSGKALVPPTLTPLPSVRRNIRDTIIIISTTTDMEVRITSKQYNNNNNIIHIQTSISIQSQEYKLVYWKSLQKCCPVYVCYRISGTLSPEQDQGLWKQRWDASFLHTYWRHAVCIRLQFNI